MKSNLQWVLALTLCAFVGGCDDKSVAIPVTPADTATDTASTKKATPVAKSSSDYSVKVLAPDVRVGEPGKVRVEIKPASAFKINTEYPWKINVPSSDQIKVANTDIGKSAVELTQKSAIFTVDCTVDSAGDHKLGAVANFSVCNDDVCKNFRDEAIEIAFQAAP